MKKIIIAILIVFSCGVLALTIPKSASAETVITENELSIDLEDYTESDYTVAVNVLKTLVFSTSTGEELFLTSIDIEYYTYIDYGLSGSGQPIQEKYLFGKINTVYLTFEYYILNEYEVSFILPLSTEQYEELVFNTGISVTEFVNASRDLDNLIVNGLSLSLFIQTDGIIFDLECGLALEYSATDSIGSYTYYTNEWDPEDDTGYQFGFAPNYYSLDVNRIIPPNIQAYRNRYELITHVRQNVTPFPEGDLTSWITDAVSPILNFQIFPGFSLALILGIILAFGLLFMILKLFAGG